MMTLVSKVATVAAGLTTALKFTGDVSGTEKSIVYHQALFPPRTPDADSYPACLVIPRGFSGLSMLTHRVELIYALHNTDRTNALADIDSLFDALRPLAKPGIWSPWKLQGMSGYPGDRDNGIQPHPEYFLTISLDFAGPSGQRF